MKVKAWENKKALEDLRHHNLEPERETNATFKEFTGFQKGLVRLGQVSYQYGSKYPQLEVEKNPFTNCPKDDNVPMEVDVPFDDSIDLPPHPIA
ncbi:hypothetical protein BHE74_00002240 [Ensete ventricosum]|nr:hypothetical protein GW17_00045377 [Ensete ventricosum]RWW88865.1 hypothetical protein BHE74_00002240 [Ensete ventricosum]RZR98467.1 hypothetical protein BHM03_00027821 [Ensete ventricosum]